MFSCGTCIRRAVLSLAADISIQTPLLLPIALNPRPRIPSQTTTHYACHHRTTTTLRSIKRGHHRRILVAALTKRGSGLPPANTRRKKAVRLKVEQRDRLARENNEKHLANPEYQKQLERSAAKEAPFLVDPLRLSDEVHRNLQIDGFDKALALVRASEKQGLIDGKKRGQVNNIVSWNHLCDYCMAQRDPQLAMKIFNELKKRGHQPDAHTYTIMLRGFAENIRKPNAVADAMRIYNGMWDPSSAVKPNTIHNNAIITVCAKGGRMDELWSVAGRLPEKGLGAADHVTYTVILKAIEREAIVEAGKVMAKEGEGSLGAGDVFDKAIEDGRKLWRDVIIKWRRADLRIDESLVCAMGRLLLLGKRRKDLLDVFRLVEQTMGVKVSAEFEQESEKAQYAAASELKEVTVFNPVEIPSTDTPGDSDGPNSIYVQPGRNTVSMLMEAALLTKQPHVGKAYWRLLTSPNRQYQIAPDTNNIVSYLRLLRFSRAPRDIIDVLQHPWPEETAKDLHRRGVYVIAMSAAVRDKNNPNIFKIASKIVDIMQENALIARSASEVEDADADEDFEDEEMAAEAGMLDVDPKVLAMYLNLAIYTTKGINPKLPMKRMENGDLDFEREPGKNNTIRALHRMGPDTVNLRRLLRLKLAEIDRENNLKASRQGARRFAGSDRGWINGERSLESLDDLVGLVRAMVSAYDRILKVSFKLSENGKGPLANDVVMESRLQKAKLTSYLGKVDKKLLDRGIGGRSGLWEGYDPAQVDAEEPKSDIVETEGSRGDSDSYGSRWRNIKGGEDRAVSHDSYLMRSVGGARLKKAVKREETMLEKEMGDSERLSRRQKHEKEKDRREERVRKLRVLELKDRMGRPITEPEKRKLAPQGTSLRGAITTRVGTGTGRARPGPPGMRGRGAGKEKSWVPGKHHREWKGNDRETGFVQKGWGGGFSAMARQTGQEDGGRLLELGR